MPAEQNNTGRNVSLGLTLALHGMNHAMFNMLSALSLAVSGYFRFDNLSHVSAGISLYLACYGFGQIPVGFMSDRSSRKLLLGGGAILNGGAVAVVALFPSYKLFLFCMAAAGFGAAAYHPVGAAYVSELFKKARGSALGLSGIGATVGLFLGPWMGGRLNEQAGWQTTFLVFAALSVFLGVSFILFAKEPERETKPADTSGGNGWGRALIVFLVMAALVFTFREFGGWGGFYLLPIFCMKAYGATSGYAGFITGLQSAGGFIAQPLGGWLSDRLGRRPLMAVLLFFSAAFMFLIPFAGQRFLIPTVFLYSIAYTATVPIIDALIADRTPSHIRGSVFGLFMATGIGLGSLSPIAQAFILDRTGASMIGFHACFGLLAGSILVSMIILLLFRHAED